LIVEFKVLVLTHFAVGFLGFALGGFVAYRLILRKMKSRVKSYFDFGDAGALIDAITEVDSQDDK